MEGFVVAQCLDVWGRACFEVLLQQGLGNAEVALCLGRSSATVCKGEKNVALRVVIARKPLKMRLMGKRYDRGCVNWL